MKERLLLPLLLTISSLCMATETGRWTLEDSIELSYFLLPNEKRVAMLAVDAAKPVLSPDSKLFYVISERGNLAENINRTELRVYSVSSVRAALGRAKSEPPKPVVAHVARSRISGSMDSGIKDVLWGDDSRTLTFLEYGVDVVAQVRRLNIASGMVETLSNAPLGVTHYAVERDVVAYAATMTSRRGDVADVIKSPFSYVREQEWFAALQFTLMTNAAFVRPADGATIQASTEVEGIAPEVFPSPDGNWVIVKKNGEPLSRLPDWARQMVRDSGLRPIMVESLYLRNLREPIESERFLGLSGFVFERVGVTAALWSPDSRRAILINAVIPAARGFSPQTKAPNLVEMDVETGDSRVIGAMPGPKPPRTHPDPVEARWIEPGTSLALQPLWGAQGDTVVHSLRDGQWSSRMASAQDLKNAERAAPRFPPGLEVDIRQGLNEPPQLIASSNGKQLTLWDPNPALAEKRPLPIERIQWTDEHGITWDGNLVLPRHPKPASGYPLVLSMAHQTYPKHFMPDGYAYAPGNAAQEMAAHGMAQLTLNTSNPATNAHMGTPKEGPDLLAAVDAAVAELAHKGLVDPTRVGVMGYSRMGWATLYVSTHHRGFVPAAAIVQDAWDASYLQYVHGATIGDVGSPEYSKMYSEKAVTFWDDKQAWMDAPGFMMDRMQSPLLIQHHYGPYIAGLLTMVEPYAAMRNLGRPVEVVAFNGGAHVHTQPVHRLASMQLAVDWMRFWLKGEENLASEHMERNEYWRSMRARWADRPTSPEGKAALSSPAARH